MSDRFVPSVRRSGRPYDNYNSKLLTAHGQSVDLRSQIVVLEDYRGFKKAAEAVDKLFPDRRVRILDVGAGTGLVGIEVSFGCAD